MGSHRHDARRRTAVLLFTSFWSGFVEAINVDVCASMNTASTARNISIYQSNGLCHDHCVNDFAFAVTQTSGCWCTDYYPDEASQVDPSKCNYPCPGYPPEDCGGLSGGTAYYGYIQLNLVLPSGTASSPSSSVSSTSTSKSSSSSQSMILTLTAIITQTVQVTATMSSTSTTSMTSASMTSEMPSTSTSSTSHTQTSSSSSSATSSTIQTITDSTGAVRTVTVIPTVPAGVGASRAKTSGFSSGAIAGVVIGAILAVLIAAGGIFFLWRRHKKNQDDYEDDPSIRGSSSAMMGSTHPDMSMTGDSVHSPGSVGNRNSTIQIDPRMDPFKQGLYLRTNSHESLNTLRDDHDYSRRIQPPKVLRATNPDPEDG